MIYLVVCFIFTFVAYFEGAIRSAKSSQFVGVFMAIILILFAGLRDNVGTDWNSYTDFYKHLNSPAEPGYIIVNDLFSNNHINYNVFLLFINTFCLILVYLALRKNAKLVVISLLLFYCELFLYFNFSGMRQGIAIAITLFSVQYILERKSIKFFCCIALAMTFHITAAIFVIAYFIPQEKLKFKHYFLFVTFFLFLSTIIYSLSNLVSGNLADKVKFYTELQEQDENIKSLFIIGIFKRAIIVGMVIFFGRKLLVERKTAYYFKVYIFGFAMYLSTYLISPDIGVRLSSYFLIFDIFLAANLIYVTKDIYKRVLIVTLFSLLAVYKITTYMKIETYNYNSILTTQ